MCRVRLPACDWKRNCGSLPEQVPGIQLVRKTVCSDLRHDVELRPTYWQISASQLLYTASAAVNPNPVLRGYWQVNRQPFSAYNYFHAQSRTITMRKMASIMDGSGAKNNYKLQFKFKLNETERVKRSFLGGTTGNHKTNG